MGIMGERDRFVRDVWVAGKIQQAEDDGKIPILPGSREELFLKDGFDAGLEYCAASVLESMGIDRDDAQKILHRK